MSFLTRTAIALLITGAAIPNAFAAYTVNMSSGVSPISHEIYFLHMLIFVVCCVIGVGVFGAMFYAIVRHRKASGHQPAQFHESTAVEIIWTLIPFLILIGMAIPASKVLIAMSDTRESDLSVKITGYQWKWHYEYMGEGVQFFSNLKTTDDAIANREPKPEHYLLEVDNRLVLPAGKKIRFLMTANDVIHSWWVPMFGVKKDAIPGFINETWTLIETPGVYRGQCAELCGAHHGFMPIVVEVKSADEFNVWLAEQKAKTTQKKPVTVDAQAVTPKAKGE